MLHIISRSPFESSALRDCLKVARSGDVLLLLADAVYATTQPEKELAHLNVQALEEHVVARGLPRSTWVTYIDYGTMVELTEQHHPIQTWF